MKPLRILHAPTTVGGNPQGLAKAECALGQASESITVLQNYFQYDAPSIFNPKHSLLRNEFRRWRFIFKALRNYDVIHYNFGSTLSPKRYYDAKEEYSAWKIWIYSQFYARWVEFIDLRLAKWFGKVIAVTYQGDDARQSDYCKAHYFPHPCHEPDATYYSESSDRLKRSRIALFNRYADVIYALNPDLLRVLPRRTKFLTYACVDPREWKATETTNAVPEIPHVVHAPSHRAAKGTKYLLKAFERLQAEGIPFRYTLVEGLSNKEARKVYASADLLVDQLLIGYYGGLAVELMSLGKPVICFLRPADFGFMPEAMREELPLIDANPDTIYDVLKLWLTERKGELHARGEQSRAYVEKWHDPMKIAASLIEDYQAAWQQKQQR